MATINVLDSVGATVALEKPLVPGRAAAASSRPVALSTEDAAFLDGIETALAALGTQTTSAAILAKIIAAPATEAKQDNAITQETAINAILGAISGAAVITDANGTVQQYLRGLVKQWIAGTLVLGAGTNNIGDVDVLTVVTGTAATNLGKAIDAVGGATDTGVAALAIRDDALTTLTPVDGDYVALRVNATGALHVTGGGGGTEYTEDAAAAADPTGQALLAVRRDTLSASEVSADGDNIALKSTSKGQLHVANDHLTIAGVAVATGSGAMNTGTQRVAMATDSPGVTALGNAAMAASLPVTIASNQTTFPVTLTNFGAGEYETVAASQTAQVLGPTGATGDWLQALIIIPATTSPGQVLLLDNATSITVFVGGATSASNLWPVRIDFGMASVSGAWKVTTGANVSVIGIGNFT